jgi:hypothetical protein
MLAEDPPGDSAPPTAAVAAVPPAPAAVPAEAPTVAPLPDPIAVDNPADDPEAGRIFGVIPDNKIVPSTKASTEEPLTAGRKFGLAWKDTIDPFTFVLAGFYAGLAQWQNDYPTWKQGGLGYAKRFGAAYADQVVGNYLTEAILPALLREDPRYFRKGSGGGRARTYYALTRVLITRTDRGKNEFNYSEFVGNAAAAGVSNLYYPASERTVGETGEKFAIQIASDAAFNILLEFWPDMHRMMVKRVPFVH